MGAQDDRACPGLFIVAGLVSIWITRRPELRHRFRRRDGGPSAVRQSESIGDVRAALARPELRAVVVQEVGAGGRGVSRSACREQRGSRARADADAVKAGPAERFWRGTRYDILRVETGRADGRKGHLLATGDPRRAARHHPDGRSTSPSASICASASARRSPLIHDVPSTIAALSIANMEFDLTTVAALLTVVGFSVNDTVIISDRIRETMRKSAQGELRERCINLSRQRDDCSRVRSSPAAPRFSS